MAGRSQHRDNRSSYFSTDIGRSGIYDSVNGTPFNFSQRGDNPNNLRNIEGISETERESGLYASRIGSTKQPTEDYSKEGMLGSTGNFPRQNWDQSFEEGNRTPESGTYSRNIEAHERVKDYKANYDITRSSTNDNTRDSGLYSRKIGSFRETIPEKDMVTPFPDNFGLDNQRQSSKHFKPNKYTGNNLETMLEGDDESKQPEHYNSTFYSESRKVSDTRRNTDYDGHSNASFQDDKEMPSWTDMLFDRQFTDDYIKKTWPKITLPLANTRKNDPFAPTTDDEGSNTIDEKSGTQDHKVRNTLCVIGLGTLLLCLVGAAILTIALVANQRTDKTDYVKVNMTVSIDKTFTAGLNDPNSPEYKNFTTEFCNEMKNVYASTNTAVDGYYGCKVNQLTNGSIIVNYFIYFISTANQQVTSNAVSTTLTTHLTVSGSQLGTLVFITSTIIVHDVVTETLESPPVVEQIVTTTVQSTIETTTKENVPSTETTPASKTVQQTEATTLVTMQSTMETNSLTILSTKETILNTKQSTAEKSTPEQSTEETTDTGTPTMTSTGDTTSKTIQPATETTTPSITSPRETTHKTVQSTTETTTPSITSHRDTTPKTVQSTTETTTPSINTPRETPPNTVQPTTETTTPSISSTGKTTPKIVQSTTDTTTPSSTTPGETPPNTVQSTTETTTPSTRDITTPSITSIGETTPKTVQSTTATTNPSIVAIDETTTTNIQSTKGTTTPSILLTEKSTPKTMQSTTETTVTSISSKKETTPTSMQSKTSSPSISSTEESPRKTLQSTKETTLSSFSTILEPISSPPTPQVSEETTQQTFKTTEGTSTSIETEISTTQDKTSNKDSTITTPVKVTSPFIDSTIKETSKSPTTYKTPEMTTSSVTSSQSAANTEVQSTITQNKETTTYVALTDQTNASVKVSTITDTTSRSTALPEDMTSTTSEDENTVSTGRIDTSSDKTSSVKITTSEVPSSKETTATLDNVPTTTPAYEPSSDGTSTSITPSSAVSELNCTDAVEADLYSGPVTIECTIKKSEAFEYIGISHENGIGSTIYGVSVYKNGTIFITYKENQDISINVESTSTLKLIITFINVTCTMDGSYKVALISNSSGEMNEIIGENVLLKIRNPTGKPTVTLSVDQVIDLVFPDGNYYRGSGIHTCEGLIGEPPAKLEIDITYNNGTSFEPISNSNIDLVSRTNTSDECSTTETLSFGLKFSSGMDGARLRCRVSDSLTEYTLSEELSLIPRNICDCSASSSYRGHPSNCKVQVYCVTEGGIAYPRGIACASNQCRNSITGVCSDDCSATVCNETVPSDFCTTPAPPTTTPAPSPYIFCTDTIAIINSGPAVITCYLNDTATFTVMNVTYLKFGATDVQQIAFIDEINGVTMLKMEDIVSISMSNKVINITILNPSCENEGIFAVVTDINGESIKDQGKFSMISKPNGNALLQLHPDQIAGLGSYRNWLLHSCKINVGYPPGKISIEMMKQDDTEFNKLDVTIHDTNDDTDNVTCSITRTVTFGFVFTADMDKATIRCSVTNDFDTEDPFVYSNNNTVSLIPIDFCKNKTDGRSYHPHPTNCHSFVQCEGDITYGVPCPSGQCFGVTETIGCNHCYLATCPADVTTTPVPDSSTSAAEQVTTPESTSAIYVFCNSSTVIWNSGPVEMVCQLNTTDFNVLNITFRTSAQAIPTVISQIQSTGNINDLNQDDGVTVSYVDQLVTISILNASCSGGDFYGLIAVDINGKAEGKAEGKLIVGRMPTDDAVLTLHPDQIVGSLRDWHEHVCEADIGFPEGEIQIEILNQGETEFSVLNVKVLDSTEDGDSCFTRRKLEFGIYFTAIMDKAIIRCKVKPYLFPDDKDIYSNNETVSIIPSDYCKDYNDSFIPHSSNCNSYVQCRNNVPFGKPCQPTLCFGITQTVVCDFCYNAVCPSEITTTLQPESTVSVESIDVSCTDSTVQLNTQPGVITCTVNATSFSMMNVTYKNKIGQTPTIVALIHGDGNIADLSNTDSIEVAFTPFTVIISILNVSCTHEGYYGVIVDSGNDLTGKSEGRLATIEKPSGSIDIKLHPEQIIGFTTQRTYNVHTCSGQIGNPAGKIEVEILLDGAINFQTVDPSYSSSTNDTDNCMVRQVFKYLIAFTSGMYNATIRCKITNKEFPSVPPIYSTNETLALIPQDFCNINYNGTNDYPNPSDPCNRYVKCEENIPNGKACASGVCFNPEVGICDHCYNVDFCP